MEICMGWLILLLLCSKKSVLSNFVSNHCIPHIISYRTTPKIHCLLWANTEFISIVVYYRIIYSNARRHAVQSSIWSLKYKKKFCNSESVSRRGILFTECKSYVSDLHNLDQQPWWFCASVAIDIYGGPFLKGAIYSHSYHISHIYDIKD